MAYLEKKNPIAIDAVTVSMAVAQGQKPSAFLYVCLKSKEAAAN